jgi:gliding motility-associated-like protein
LILTLIWKSGLSQIAFIKEVDNLSSSKPTIVGTENGGWLTYSSLEGIIYKYDECGIMQWAHDYSWNNQSCCIGNPVVVSSNGNIAILTRIDNGVGSTFRLSVLNSNGDPIWSKLYTESNKDFYPYSLSLDIDGNYILYGIENPIGGGAGFLNVIKVNPNGLMVWQKRISDGYLWGAAIATSNGGSLIRTGNRFIKLDINGGIEWSNTIRTQASYNYLAPVEVSDGYIFTTNKNGSSNVGFLKIDKQGNTMWNEVKYTNLSGPGMLLQPLPNGHFITAFNRYLTGKSNFSVVEFDKDLNVIQSNKLIHSTNNLIVSSINVTVKSKVVVAGISQNINNLLFFGKLDTNYTTSCDDTVNIIFSSDTIRTFSGTVTVSNGNLSATDSNLLYQDLVYSDSYLCQKSIVIPHVNLGPDSSFCAGSELEIGVVDSATFGKYVWSTGETTETIKVNKGGLYWLEGGFSCVANVNSDTIFITEKVVPDPNLVTDSALCGSNPIILNAATNGATYLWQDGSSDSTYLARYPGVYFVDVSLSGCTQRFNSQTLSCEEFIIPNIFTPNGDGVNDYFFINYEGVKDFSLEIYNRWGVRVFRSVSPQVFWNGYLESGTMVANGIYFYTLSVGEDKYKGALTITK